MEVDCDIFVKSLGFKSKPIPGIPFDFANGVIPTTNEGNVIDEVK
jgi:hypothetical protein